MKKCLSLLNWLLISFIFSSCEKVIDIDLNSASPKLVVEGAISDKLPPYTVKLSKTINFDQTNIFPAVTGAKVRIDDNVGNFEILTETFPGTYTASTLQGTPGRTYTLTITDNDRSYSASSTMLPPVVLDTIFPVTLTIPEGDGIILYAGFQDPPEVKNYYRLIEIVNGVAKNIFYVTDDRFQNGTKIYFPMYDDKEQKKIVSGDSVTVLLQSIDKPVYDYFYPMYFQDPNNRANPPSNVSNGALGYFSGYSVTSKKIVIR